MITVLSLFDGLGGAKIALDRLGIPCKYYASEIDKYAIKIAIKNYPDIIQLGDIENIKAEDLPQIDLLIGGSPCQDLSIAKMNRKGLQGERSGLFWEYVKLLKELKPKYFLLENVNSMKKTTKQIITNTMGIEPIMINSALLTAQNRKRLYWTNIHNIKQPKNKYIYLENILEPIVDKKYYVPSESIVRLLYPSNKGRKINRELIFIGGIISKRNLWLKNGKYYSRNFSQGNRIYSSKGKSTSLSANGGGLGAKTGLYSIYNKTLNLEKSNTLGSNSQCITAKTGQVLLVKNCIRKLIPIECERLQGLPDNYTEGVSNTQRYKMIGNGFTIPVIVHILKEMK